MTPLTEVAIMAAPTPAGVPGDALDVTLDDYTLTDRYTRDTGRIFLTGTQALVRIALRQAALDRRDGRRTAGLISGYRGSPLGGVDQALWQASESLAEANIEFVPAINEEIGRASCRERG